MIEIWLYGSYKTGIAHFLLFTLYDESITYICLVSIRIEFNVLYYYFVFFFQSPPKGATIPYRPKPQVGGPVILAGGQAYTIQGNYAVPAHTDVSSSAVMTPLFSPMPLGHTIPATAPFVPLEPLKNGQLQAAALPPAHLLPDVS